MGTYYIIYNTYLGLYLKKEEDFDLDYLSENTILALKVVEGEGVYAPGRDENTGLVLWQKLEFDT
jgi:lipoprotein NlpI